jgi:hypothetical protein
MVFSSRRPLTSGRARRRRGAALLRFPSSRPLGRGGAVSVKGGGANLTIEAEGRDPVTIPLGSLTYRSSNNYWVDQTWTYQMGAVFLSQDGGTTVRVGPSIAVAKREDGNIALAVAPISLEGSDTIAGSGPVRIETRMRWSDPSSLDGTYDRVSLTIVAEDPVTARAWERAFREVRQRAMDENVTWLPTPELLDGNKARLTIRPEAGDKKVILTVYPANYTVTVHNAASLME